MAREASIQLTYQNAWIIYQFRYPPMLELNLNSWSYPSAHWISFIVLQIISILLSGYSTFNPIIVAIQFKSQSENRPFGLMNYLVKIFQMLIHIIISTGVVSLVLGHISILIMGILHKLSEYCVNTVCRRQKDIEKSKSFELSDLIGSVRFIF